ncbi:MAG: hypothetical protein P1Q69_04710 [Candidatus Thorarchaeota archaeon]|nr:hypothetical protein [Candidatus Thorarchaeota archaeon]
MNKEVLDWNDFHLIVDTSASMEHIALACYSGDIMKTDAGKTWVGFPNKIDAQVGADFALAIYYNHQNDYESFDHFRLKGIAGFVEKMLLGVVEPNFLRMIYDDGGGGTGDPPTYDFYYSGIFWDAYNVDPSNTVYYDHPDYEKYYQTLGVGYNDAFTLDANLGVRADHIARDLVTFWKLGGLLALADFFYALGIAAAVSIIGIEVTPFLMAIAALLTGLGLTAAWLANVWLMDETGSGWVFYKHPSDVELLIKIGCGWWLYTGNQGIGVGIVFDDGHYIR